MPEGMRDNEAFPQPIITPATKADTGHDVDISGDDIIRQGILDEKTYRELERITRALFLRGTEMAAKQGLILVDTKYEFGWYRDEIYIIDEVHTPDSSRYWYKATYQENLDKGLPQEHLSKEFVREWLMSKGFQGLDGQQMPAMDDVIVNMISDRYIHLYEVMTGSKFNPGDDDPEIIESAIADALVSMSE